MIFGQGILLALAGASAGAINAVAGGGTLLTFPALLGAGLPSTVANATNTAALTPAAFTGAWNFRDRLTAADRRLLLPLGILGLVGASAGAALLLLTPVKTFDRLIPVLIFAATLIFAFQDRLKPKRPADSDTPAPELRVTPPTALFLFAVAVYGGYFGAGIGILSLAALGMLGLTDIHRMNAVKAVFAGGVNAVAALIFIARGLVHWPEAALTCASAILGAWVGARLARRLGGGNVRRLVVVLGVGMALLTLWRLFR